MSCLVFIRASAKRDFSKGKKKHPSLPAPLCGTLTCTELQLAVASDCALVTGGPGWKVHFQSPCFTCTLNVAVFAPFSGKDNFPMAVSTANENECSAVPSCLRAAVCCCRWVWRKGAFCARPDCSRLALFQLPHFFFFYLMMFFKPFFLSLTANTPWLAGANAVAAAINRCVMQKLPASVLISQNVQRNQTNLTDGGMLQWKTGLIRKKTQQQPLNKTARMCC